jgi:hypothetical protein
MGNLKRSFRDDRKVEPGIHNPVLSVSFRFVAMNSGLVLTAAPE